jgi:hypothetical protein
MAEKLTWEQHQTARKLAGQIADLRAADATHVAATKAGELRALIRQQTDLGERFLTPSGQTVAAFETALAVWTL